MAICTIENGYIKLDDADDYLDISPEEYIDDFFIEFKGVQKDCSEIIMSHDAVYLICLAKIKQSEVPRFIEEYNDVLDGLSFMTLELTFVEGTVNGAIYNGHPFDFKSLTDFDEVYVRISDLDKIAKKFGIKRNSKCLKRLSEEYRELAYEEANSNVATKEPNLTIHVEILGALFALVAENPNQLLKNGKLKSNSDLLKLLDEKADYFWPLGRRTPLAEKAFNTLLSLYRNKVK